MDMRLIGHCSIAVGQRRRCCTRIDPLESSARSLMEAVDLLEAVRRHAIGIQQAKDLDHLRIELGSGVLHQLVQGLDMRERLLVGALVDHGVVRVCDGHDPRAERDLLAAQAVRVAGSVEAFVVMQHDRDRIPQARGLLQDQLSDARMLAPYVISAVVTASTRWVSFRV